MMSWSEACRCHTVESLGKALTVEEKLVTRMGKDCPMRGRRAGDLAHGKWRDFFAQVKDSSLVAIRADASLVLTKTDVDIIVGDFLKGTAEQEAVLEQKFAFWQMLPWSLCGLAVYDVPLGRACASMCIDHYDRLPDCAHHRVSNKFLSPSGSLRAQVWQETPLMEPLLMCC